MSDRPSRPESEYGEWGRGNAGQVGRTVTNWYWSDPFCQWIPIVEWEPHPDEAVPREREVGGE